VKPSPEIADQAGAERGDSPPLPQVVNLAAQELAREKGADQYRKSDELPAQPTKHAQRDCRDDGKVNCEEPLQGIPGYVGPPVAEGQVEYQYRKCHDPQIHSRE